LKLNWRDLANYLLISFLVGGELVPAHWASIVLFQPWLQALRVVNVSARHKHPFRSYSNVLTTNCAGWGLQCSCLVLLAVFVLYFYNRELGDWVFGSFLLFGLRCLLGTHPLSHLHERFIWKEVALEVGHELIWREPLEDCIHPQEFMACEHILEVSEHRVEHLGEAIHLWVSFHASGHPSHASRDASWHPSRHPPRRDRAWSISSEEKDWRRPSIRVKRIWL